ncbi:transcriptional regulator [Paenibacillus riograndensis]|uniref:Helix-turn-helix domain protein n=2 Tax=Paenibacillus riograndensis TaxID=483937 RepID=A0A0E4CUA5_9BACL|nr:transcriptional regulator [Paenibacillus riograndensis]CQR51699.1 helix-turn-helix domain protein [Paenibacillus riograndensis SBR5]
MEPAPTILAEMEEYIRREGLSISQFAERSGIHSGTLSNMLHGRRPIAMQQLDRVTRAMGLAEGYYYDLYIDNYIVDGSSDWRRVGPLLQRCAELGKLDSIRRVVRIVTDNLSYLPALFDRAEELYAKGRSEAAALLYEGVAESEKYQHSERLALCQYRLFRIGLCEDQDENLRLANQFESYVERLDEADQLDALKHLADVFASLHNWSKVDELGDRLGRKSDAQYKYRKKNKTQKQPDRPLIYYKLYAYLLRAAACDETGDHSRALHFVSLYSDTSWVELPASKEEERVMEQFKEWATANSYLYRLTAGDIEIIPEYINYVESRENEIFPALFKIIQAANRYKFNVDDILIKFNTHLYYKGQSSRSRKANQQLVSDRYTQFLIELAVYYLTKKKWDNGLFYLLESLESSIKIRSDSYIVKCVGLFEKYRSVAGQQQRNAYANLIGEVQRINEEKDGYMVILS